MSSPSISTWPAVGSWMRLIMRTSVDLPEPDNPMTTKTSPWATSNETSRTAATQPGLREQFTTRQVGVGRPDDLVGLGPVDLPHVATRDRGVRRLGQGAAPPPGSGPRRTHRTDRPDSRPSRARAQVRGCGADNRHACVARRQARPSTSRPSHDEGDAHVLVQRPAARAGRRSTARPRSGGTRPRRSARSTAAPADAPIEYVTTPSRSAAPETTASTNPDVPARRGRTRGAGRAPGGEHREPARSRDAQSPGTQPDLLGEVAEEEPADAEQHGRHDRPRQPRRPRVRAGTQLREVGRREHHAERP